MGQTEFTLVDMVEKLPIGKIITAVDEARSRKVVHIRYEMNDESWDRERLPANEWLVIFLTKTNIILPKPELYVIYTGNRKTHPEWLTLEEEFFKGQDAFVNVKVKVLYDGEEGDIINQYVTFTRVYNEQVKEYGRTRKAVLETIHICKQRNILAEYLGNREKEVFDIMMTLFDQEYAVERYGDEQRAEGRAEGVDLIAKLIKILIQQNRNEDIERMSEDREYCNQLLKEFALV